MNAVISTATDQQWFLLRTAASKERLAADLLQRRGFQTYCPMRVVWRRPSRYTRRDQKQVRLIALLPRYLFVGFTEDSLGWPAMFEPACVLSWVGFSGRPYRISGTLIDEWKDRFGDVVSGPKVQRWMKSNKEFLAGDLVFIVEGAFANPMKQVKVEEIRGRAARIWSNLFGGRYVFVPLAHLERVE